MNRPVAVAALMALFPAASAFGEKLPPSAIADLRDRVMGCWSIPAGLELTSGVQINFRLNADGSLNGEPTVVNPPANDDMRKVEQSAVRAIKKCAPFAELTKYAESYEDWKDITINFQPDMVDALDAPIQEKPQPAPDAVLEANPIEPRAIDTIPGLGGVELKLTRPDGYCPVEPEKSGFEREYLQNATELMRPANKLLAFYLDCGYLEAVRDGSTTADPPRWITMQAETPAGPEPARTAPPLDQYLPQIRTSLFKLMMPGSPGALAYEALMKSKSAEIGQDIGMPPPVVAGSTKNGVYLFNMSLPGGGEPQKAAVTIITAINGYPLGVTMVDKAGESVVDQFRLAFYTAAELQRRNPAR